MPKFKSTLNFFVSASLLTMLVAAPLNQGARAQQPVHDSDTPVVLFVVQKADAQAAAIIEPIATLRTQKIEGSIAGDSEPAEITQFGKRYYRAGQKYRVLSGGGEAGSLTIKRATPDQECSRTAAEVTIQSPVQFNRNVMALATNSAELGRGASSRRAPTAAERAALLPLVREQFRKKGVPAALLSSVATVNLTASDLNGDGRFELIGTFVAKKRTKRQARYPLFLIAEPDGQSYRTTVLQFQRVTENEIMGGGDIDAVGENGIYTERLIDVLDLDRDGASEVLTLTDGFEGVTYTIYKKESGAWRQIFETSSYRCGF